MLLNMLKLLTRVSLLAGKLVNFLSLLNWFTKGGLVNQFSKLSKLGLLE